MPTIVGIVNQLSNGTSVRCPSFQVQCLNKPVTPKVFPPYFFLMVACDEYVFQITNPQGQTATAVAPAWGETNQQVSLNVTLA